MPDKILFLTLMLFQISVSALGQISYEPPKIPEKYIKALSSAVLDADAGMTNDAIIKINELINRFPTWLEPRHQLSRIYYQAGKKNESIATLEEAVSMDTNSQLQQLFTLGRLYEETSDFKKAMTVYEKVILKGIHQPSLAQRAAGNLRALEEKTKAMAFDYTISLVPIPDGINSIDHEALGRWTVDGAYIIFTRFVGGQEDLYIARLADDGLPEWIEEFPFNTEFNEGGHTISPDGKYLVYTSCDRRDGLGSCDLYLSVLTDSMWTTPVNMGPAFNSPGWDSQPSFGLDGLSIWFASTRPGGFGGSDIWFVEQVSRGRWSKPTNAGPAINTTDNEESPFIHFDGRTMYFMRDGKNGLGGYDLYMSRKALDGHWQEPINMGAPINSISDEGALAIHPDGRRAMITRKVEERRNELFEFTLPERFQSSPVQVLYLQVSDSESGVPVRAQVEVFEINGQDTIRISQTADVDGKITVTLELNKPYGLIGTAENYMIHSTHLPADSSRIRQHAFQMTPLAKIASRAVVLENIFFETGSALLLPASYPELHKLLQILHENPTMKIEIRGHTDNVGSDADNQELSDNRAKAVYQYLIDNKIEESRLSFKGYGESQPIANNESETGRQKNRRTEFVILNL
jgi:outer membrane protein OmpA-like peptidoglycan-associated protein/Tol biopolymer transport system component